VEVDYMGRTLLVANVIFVVARKVATSAVLSDFRRYADNRDRIEKLSFIRGILILAWSTRCEPLRWYRRFTLSHCCTAGQ